MSIASLPVVAPDVIQAKAKADPRADLSVEMPSPGSSPGERVQVAGPDQDRSRLPFVGTQMQTAATGSPSMTRRTTATERSWSGSIWIAAREGSGASLAAGAGQLGGSQAGLRVYRNLTPALALTGRVSTSLAAKGTEASAGILARRGAFALLAERRFAIDSGGRNDWSLTAVAGVSDIALAHGVRLDGYAQAGLVGRDGFADGALRAERTVLGDNSDRLSVGAGIWGSIQPGVARLDVGPQVIARIIIANRPMRLSGEWRQRIAGNAAPGSGPVVTLGADF
jgi:hypothetical protein